MRVVAILGCVVTLVLAACALTPNQAHVSPDYPPPTPLGCPVRRVDDAGFVTTVSQCVIEGRDHCGRPPCDAGRE